jgi:hypothetical protein
LCPRPESIRSAAACVPETTAAGRGATSPDTFRIAAKLFWRSKTKIEQAPILMFIPMESFFLSPNITQRNRKFDIKMPLLKTNECHLIKIKYYKVRLNIFIIYDLFGFVT